LLYNNISTVYGNMEEYKEVVKYLEKSKQIYTELENQPGMIMVDYNLGNVYLGQENYEQAIYYFEKSLGAAKTIEYNDYITSNYKALMEAYSGNCDHENFVKYFGLDMHVTDSLLANLNEVEMLEVETNFKVAKVTKENLGLKNQINKQNRTIKRNWFLLIGLGSFALILLIGLSLIVIKR